MYLCIRSAGLHNYKSMGARPAQPALRYSMWIQRQLSLSITQQKALIVVLRQWSIT